MGNPIAVLGGGSWGTALAHLLAHAGHDVTLLLRDAAQAAHINAHHENPRYLRGVPLYPGIRAVAGSMGGPEQAAALEGVGVGAGGSRQRPWRHWRRAPPRAGWGGNKERPPASNPPPLDSPCP